MIEGETPEEYQRRRRREAVARYNASEKAKAARERYEYSDKGAAAHERYVQTDKAKQTRADYFASPEGRAMLDRRNARKRADRATLKQELAERPKAPPPFRLPWQNRTGMTEEQRRAANRELVQRNEAAAPYKEKGGRPPKGERMGELPQVDTSEHRVPFWWRKIGE